MQVHPDVARLRSDGAPQPLTDAALAAWRATPAMAAVREALAAYDAGVRLDSLPALARLLSQHGAAAALVEQLLTPLLAALRAEPLAQLPFGHAAGSGPARLRLAEHGRSALSLAVYARRRYSAPASALFEDCTAHEIIVAGEAQAQLHRLEAGRLTSTTVACTPGVRLTRPGADTARQIVAVDRPLLVLQLTREPLCPGPSREIALNDGRCLTTISASKRESQQMMALGVLGALDHRAGVPAMAALACDAAAQRDLRWEALRQVLALDPARGMALLAAMAGETGDQLHAPAAALQRQLLAVRPDLAALLPEPA